MKYCTYCGNQLDDNDAFCAKCGRKADSNNQNNNSYNNYNDNSFISSNDSGLVIAIKVLMVIHCAILAFTTLGFGLIWSIPMTISYFNRIKRGQKISTGFKVCTLIFVSVIAGALMLIDENH